MADGLRPKPPVPFGVNVVLGNLKRAISGVYHAIAQGKYANRYLAEAAYRFNRRFRLREMAAATRYGDDALQALPGSGSAHGKPFPWLESQG